MSTTNTVTFENKSSYALNMFQHHLHINHYKRHTRERIEQVLGHIPANKTVSLEIKADSSSYASTLEMSFYITVGSEKPVVRYCSSQDGSTKAAMNKNQTGIPAGAYTDEHHIYFVFGGNAA